MEIEQLAALDRKLVLRLRAEIAQMVSEREGLIRVGKERGAKMHELEGRVSTLKSALERVTAENNELKERYLKNADSHLEWQEEVIKNLLKLVTKTPPEKEKQGISWDIEAPWIISSLKRALDTFVDHDGDPCKCGDCHQCDVREVLIFVMEQSGRDPEE